MEGSGRDSGVNQGITGTQLLFQTRRLDEIKKVKRKRSP